ncbi:polysaccharide biosynthesis-domain-containing protein [Geopyxis carbonaria]|nr:polysaccharide biosynthesis-domain-containing protein [Geopyxis carbonaria]
MSKAVSKQSKTFNAEEADNLEDIEKQFAVKAVMHAQIYWSILERTPGSTQRLTKHDSEILTHLHLVFPDFDASAPIDEDAMKSKAGKEKWRKFMMAYEKTVEDYNFGTLLRKGARDEYEQESTIFVPRMQFYAVEIARNAKGLNDWVYEEAEKERQKKREAAEKAKAEKEGEQA